MTTSELETAVTRWSGEDQEFWDAVAAYNDPDADEIESIAAAVMLQQVLMLAQYGLEKLAGDTNTSVDGANSSPARIVVQPAQPGDTVTADRAVGLFADGWILRPIDPPSGSGLSAMRDYRLHDSKLQWTFGHPVNWRDGDGKIADCQKWLVLSKQSTESANGRSSRTSLSPATGT